MSATHLLALKALAMQAGGIELIGGGIALDDTELEAFAASIRASAVQAQAEPFAYYVYIADEQRGEFVHDLDEATDDLTNCDCQVTELYAAAPVQAAEPEHKPSCRHWKGLSCTCGIEAPAAAQPAAESEGLTDAEIRGLAMANGASVHPEPVNPTSKIIFNFGELVAYTNDAILAVNRAAQTKGGGE